jgi:hypothetical protein
VFTHTAAGPSQRSPAASYYQSGGLAFRDPDKIGRVSGISGRKRSRTVRKCIQKLVRNERRKTKFTTETQRTRRSDSKKDDPSLRSFYSRDQEFGPPFAFLPPCPLCLCGEYPSLRRSIFGSFAGGAHFYQFRVESAEYLNQVGLSGHYAIDIFVNAGNLIQAGAQ